MSHFIVRCRCCNKVLNQCRCADLNKELRYEICEGCSSKMRTVRLTYGDSTRTYRGYRVGTRWEVELTDGQWTAFDEASINVVPA